jgi:hypothetical protein
MLHPWTEFSARRLTRFRGAGPSFKSRRDTYSRGPRRIQRPLRLPLSSDLGRKRTERLYPCKRTQAWSGSIGDQRSLASSTSSPVNLQGILTEPAETVDFLNGTLLSAAWTALRGVTRTSCSRDHQNAFTSVAPLKPPTRVARLRAALERAKAAESQTDKSRHNFQEVGFATLVSGVCRASDRRSCGVSASHMPLRRAS